MHIIKKIRVTIMIWIVFFSSIGHYFPYIKTPEVHAAGASSKVDLVALLVDDVIFESIKDDLQRYTTTYIPKHAPGTKTLVIPIKTSGFYATDIQKMLANLYHEGEKGVPSQLVGVLLFGDIPMPVVDLQGKRFASIYPYVDFDEPMFRYDPITDVFLFDMHPDSLPELRHSVIPGRDVGLFKKFFTKLKQYDASPTSYAKPQIRYDDFPMMKNGYSTEERERYLNTLIFAEAEQKRMMTPTFSRLLTRSYEQDTVDTLKNAYNEIASLKSASATHESIQGDQKTEAAVTTVFQGLDRIEQLVNVDDLAKNPIEVGEYPVPTRLLERQMQDEFQPNYQMFGNFYLSELQENVLAGGRYQLEDVDTSMEKMEIRDRVGKQFITDMNTIMEHALDEKIQEEHYPLKYPLPYRFSERKPWYENQQCGRLREKDSRVTDPSSLAHEKKIQNDKLIQVSYGAFFFDRVFTKIDVYRIVSNIFPNRFFGNDVVKAPILQGAFMGGILGYEGFQNGTREMGGTLQKKGKEVFEYARYENHYFGKNAVEITGYQDLTTYRGSYFNQYAVDSLVKLPYKIREKAVDDLPNFTLDNASVGAAFGALAQQIEYNRAFNFVGNSLDDKDIYEAMRCKDDQKIEDFTFDYRGGASPLNIDFNKFQASPKHPQTNLAFTNRELAWNPSIDKQVGAQRYDPAATAVVTGEITKDKLHLTAQATFGSMIELRKESKRNRLERAISGYRRPRVGTYKSILDEKIDWCEDRKVLDEDPSKNSFDEVEYFYVYDNKQPAGTDRLGITVQPTIGAEEDVDDDRIPNSADDDMDGDLIPNPQDTNLADQIGDKNPTGLSSEPLPTNQTLSGEQYDVPFNTQLYNMDGDRTANPNDPDIDGDGKPNASDDDTDGDHLPNVTDPDIDNDGIPNGLDPDIDQDTLENRKDSDADADFIPDQRDNDIDADGLENPDDPDNDADGQPDEQEDDIDGDGEPNASDKSCGGCSGGGGSCNGESKNVDGDKEPNATDDDIDGDGVLNQFDLDMDGDGLMNVEDADMDGDGIQNQKDTDMDADKIENNSDPDMDGDGALNESDDTPNGFVPPYKNGVSLRLFQENCEGQITDVDGDGYPNGKDFDVDGDGRGNREDPDTDADGILNTKDSDLDCDGKPNGEDDDTDGDGVKNGQDSDCNGNGVPNSSDKDCDGDGIQNGDDTDVDGDGTENGDDSDVDGDQVSNNDPKETDIDGDGLDDSSDPDVDGDGYDNNDPKETDIDGDSLDDSSDPDVDGDGQDNNVDPDVDGDGIPNTTDSDIDGDGQDNDDDIDPYGALGQQNGDAFKDMLRSRREDRGSYCFLNGYDYRYQIIDTVVKHAEPVPDKLDQMDLMTFERGVDDGQYTTFHGLGGDVVEFIYPDLRNVPIYDCDLLQPKQIEEAIKTYLKQKVQHYNELLDAQLAKAPVNYSKHPAAFDFLEVVDKSATPKRSYKLMPENFFIDQIGEKQIRRLSEFLYALSVGRQRRPQAATIGEFLEKARNEFDRNKKEKYVIEEFLKHDTDDWKFDPIAFPTHIEKNYAYEVGYINSDGDDLIRQQVEVIKTEPPTPTLPSLDVHSYAGLPPGKGVGNITRDEFTKQIEASNARDAACDIGDSKAVPLTKRPKALKCRRQKTIETPLSFEFKIKVDLKEWVDPTQFNDVLHGNGGNIFKDSPAAGQLEEWKNNWKSLKFGLTPRSAQLAMGSRSLSISQSVQQYNGWSVISSPVYAQVPLQIATPQNSSARMPSTQTKKTLAGSVDIGLSNQGSFFAGVTDPTWLTISAHEDVGTIDVSLTASGSICPLVGGRNLCNGTLRFQVAPYKQTHRLPIKLSNSVAGTTKILSTICQGNLCSSESIPVIQSPGTLDNVTIALPAQITVKGGVIPLGVHGYDIYKNPLYRYPGNFALTITGGSFASDSYVGTSSLVGLDQGYHMVYPSKTSDTMRIQLIVYPDTAESQTGSVLYTSSIKLVDGQRNIIDSQGQPLYNMSYRLPNKKIGFFSQDVAGNMIVRPEQLPGFRIAVLASGTVNQLTTPVSVESLYGLVRVGYLELNDTGEPHFVDEENFLLPGDRHLNLSILPFGKSGKEVLRITSPGMEPYDVHIDILPSGPDNLGMKLDQQTLHIGSESKMNLTITDSRGNLWTDPTEVELAARGGLEFVATGGVTTGENNQKAKVTCRGGKASVTCSAKSGGSCGGGGKCGGGTSDAGSSTDGSTTNGGTTNGSTTNGSTTNGSNAGPNGGTTNGSTTNGSTTNGSNAGPNGGTTNGSTTNGSSTNGSNAGPNGGTTNGSSTNGSNGGLEGVSADQDNASINAGGAGNTCPALPSPTTTLPPAWYDDSDATYGQAQGVIPETLWPSNPDQDINVMYLNLYGYPWGNSPDTLAYLNNTKTLAITTFRNAGAVSEPNDVLVGMVHPDGRAKDLLGNVITELAAEGGSIVMHLGNQGGIGTITLGSHAEFDMLQAQQEYSERPNKLVYTPGGTDSVTQKNIFEDGKLLINDETMIDFIRGYMDPRVSIRWSGAGSDRWVMIDNKQVGTIWIYRDPTQPLETTLLHPDYSFKDTQFGSSTSSSTAVGIYLQTHATDGDTSSLFESIEASFDPKKNIGFRHPFKPITNFAQGMRVGPATQQFGGPFLLNYGDPFLERVKESRTVQQTDYDEGPGQAIFSDTKSFTDVDVGDLQKDGKKDLIISYKDGSIRILKNYGGAQPYKDLGSIIVVADGLKETFVGDVNGDGREDLMVSTKSDKLRVYLNNRGEISVDGSIVCLDIPNGDKNVAQVRQLFADDMDGDKLLDVITNDINGDIKVFYGGATSAGPNYLSKDEFACDPDWKSRQKQQLVKSFAVKLSGSPIRDSSLRYWPGLRFEEETTTNDVEHTDEYEEEDGTPGPGDDMNKKEMKEYARNLMKKKISEVKSAADPKDLFERGKEELDLRFELPDMLRPPELVGIPNLAAVKAQDKVFPETPRFDVEKTLTDLNGGSLQKGDLVKVDVSLIPVGTAGPVVYRERLDGPRVINKDEYNAIPSFSKGTIPDTANIDRNIGQGYQFMISNLPLGGTVTFSYEAQYDGNGYVNIQIETAKKEWFKGPTNQSIADAFPSVFAQQSRVKRIRTYPDDGCRKEYWLFSPGEQKIAIDTFLQEKEEVYNDHVEESRTKTENIVSDNTTFDPIQETLGISPTIKNAAINKWLSSLKQRVGGGGDTFALDPDTYLQYFVDKAVTKIADNDKEDAAGLFDFDNLGLFPDGYEFSKNKCQGFQFGKKMCGGGRPIPFNNDLLSPGAFHIFGCKPKAPIIPRIFPDFKGLPIFAVPTNSIIPIRPPSPPGAGGIFGGSTSQFRAYITRTTANGLGASLCFGSYDLLKLPTPLGDIVGNCLVFAGNLGSSCTAADPKKQPANVTPKKISTPKETESMTLLPEQLDAYKIGMCDELANGSSPFISTVNGNQVVIPGEVTELQNTDTHSSSRAGGGQSGKQSASYHDGVTIEDVVGGAPGDVLAVDYLRGGVGFQLKVEEGKINGLVKCIFRKRKENQIAYFVNNALNMQITLVLPKLDTLTEGWENVKNIDTTDWFSYNRTNRRTAFQQRQKAGVYEKFEAPENTVQRFFPPKSITTLTNQLRENPFDKIQQFFDAVPIIELEQRDIAIEVPLIYSEDFTRYTYYLQSWLDRNNQILSERGKVDWIDSNALDRMQQTVNAVQRNLTILQQYKSLPGKLHALLHSTDQYVTEVFSFVDTFVDKLTAWLQDNSMRFSQRVDVIIAVKGIVKTRQLLIDFSVNRQDRCSKCRQDNYDYYSCKLKLLCVDLPIIPIPSFHLPNIYIDLSDIHAGIDIIIPKFRLVPRKVTLIEIPDLPLPRTTAVDITIPTVPILPTPPDLPELPELTLDADINLPTLPPAPKIPSLSPSIKAVIKIMDVLGKFFCIFKGGIGLVREKNVKARVEQMTQRKSNIMPFDGLKIKMPVSPLQAYDYKVDASVDLKFDFSILNDEAQKIADDRSAFVNKASNAAKNETIEFFKPLTDAAENVSDGIDLGVPDIKVDLTDDKLGEVFDDYIVDTRGEQKPRILVGGNAPNLKEYLLDSARYVLARQDLTGLHPQANKIIQEMRTDPDIHANTAGVQLAGKKFADTISPYQDQIRQWTNDLQTDYDGFLDGLSSKAFLSDTPDHETFVSSLYEGNKIVVDQIRNEPSPMSSYLALNKTLLDGFRSALDRYTPDELEMHEVRYADLKRHLDSVNDRVEAAEQIVATASTPSQFGRTSLTKDSIKLASVANPPVGGNPGVGTAVGSSAQIKKNVGSSLGVDFSQFIGGFYIPGKDGDYHNIIHWEDKGTERFKNHSYTVADVNDDGQIDVINFDEHQIYIKYGKQQDRYEGGGKSDRYQVGPFASYDQLIQEVQDKDGRYSVGGEKFKLRHAEEVSYEFSRQGQNYSSMSFSRNNDPRQDGYVLVVTDEQQTSPDQRRASEQINDPSRTRYILLLPESIKEKGLSLEIPDMLSKSPISSLLRSGRVIEVRYYNAQSTTIEAILKNLPRKRYYAKLAPLHLEHRSAGGVSGLFGNKQRVLKKIGPRSRQQLAGAQKRADDQIPGVDLQLIRDITGEIKSRGPLLQGNINTTYTLKAQRHDNGKVIKNRVVRSGAVTQLEDGDKLEIKGIDYKEPKEESLLFVGVDQAGNIGQQEVRLQIGVPELKINEIRYLGAGAEVETQLSDTIDRGLIKFQKNRFGSWKPLQPDTFPVKPTDPIVVGGLYQLHDEINIIDDAGKRVATIDSKNGAVTLDNQKNDGQQTAGGGSANAGNNTAGNNGGNSAGGNTQGGASAGGSSGGGKGGGGGGSCGTRVSCNKQGTPQVEIVQNQGSGEKVLMQITYTPERLIGSGVELLDVIHYQLRDLDDAQLGLYNGGRCVSPLDAACHIYISKRGEVLIPAPWNALYVGSVAYEGDTIIYTFASLAGQPVVRIHFVSASFQ